MLKKMMGLIFLLLICFATSGFAGEVDLREAKTVAQNWLTAYVHTYHRWAESSAPKIVGEEVLTHQGQVVGYNFLVAPKGHIVVPFRDELPVVKLYSDTTTLSMANDTDVARWVKEVELFQVYETLDAHAEELAEVDWSATPNGRLRQRFTSDPQMFLQEYSTSETDETLSVGPLLSTTWSQGTPYNLQTPDWYNGDDTVTGCVATAAAQIMNYWQHPAAGQGSTSYSWYNGSSTVTLSENFNNSTYSWGSMLNSYSGGVGTTTQQNAVAKLMSDVGIAFHMTYGRSVDGGSGASTQYGTTVYPNYFKYKGTIQYVYRSNYASDSAWMQVFKAEVQAGRPSQFRASDDNGAGGHSFVVDGYRDSPAEQLHINLGWAGSYDGWYVSNNMATGSYDWNSGQAALIGIEPETGTGYCQSASGDASYEWISRVQLNTGDQTSGGAPYSDFTGSVLTTLTPGTLYTLSITGTTDNSYTENVKAWIDFNQNGNFFDDGEAVDLGSATFSGNHVFSNSLTVPSDALEGETRMRVIMKYNSPIGGPCENGYSYGETEDYSVEIKAAPKEVTMVVFGSRLFQAYRDDNNNILTRSTTDGTTWSSWIANGKTPGPITMTEFGGKLYQAVRGVDGQTIYTRSTTDGTNWSAWTANGKTTGRITMTEFGSRLYQAVRGMDGKTIYTRSTADGANWSAWSGNGLTPGDISMIVFGSRLYQAVRGADGKTIYTRSTADGANWSVWSGNGLTTGAITMTAASAYLYQAVRGMDGKTIYTRSTTDGTNWSAWSGNGLTNGTIAMTFFTTAYRLYQAVRGMDGQTIYTRYLADPNGAWGTWTAGGSTTGDIAMTQFGSGLYQAVIGGNGSVYTRYTFDGDIWSSWGTGSLSTLPAPDAVHEDHWELSTAPEDAQAVIVRKAGTGNGTIVSGRRHCDESCRELVIPYAEGDSLTLEVAPAGDARFVGWQTANGESVNQVYYALPGEVVYAVFELRP